MHTSPLTVVLSVVPSAGPQTYRNMSKKTVCTMLARLGTSTYSSVQHWQSVSQHAEHRAVLIKWHYVSFPPRCLHCDVVFRTLQGQKTHIEEKHCDVFYKCAICPVAFKTSEGCEVHMKNKHSSSKISPQ